MYLEWTIRATRLKIMTHKRSIRFALPTYYWNRRRRRRLKCRYHMYAMMIIDDRSDVGNYLDLQYFLLTSNCNNYDSIEFITQNKTHTVVSYDIVKLLTLGDHYHVTLTSEELKIIIFHLGTPAYHNVDTKTMKLTRIRPYLYCQWPF